MISPTFVQSVPAISLSVIAPKLQGLHEEEVYITWFAAQFDLDSLVWVANGLSLSTRLGLVHVSQSAVQGLLQNAYQVVSSRSNKHATGENLACNTAACLIGTWPVCRVASRVGSERGDRHCVTRVRSVSSCQVAPVSRRTGCLSHVPEVIKKGPRTCGWRELRRNQEKHPMCTRLLSSSCFSAPST